MPAIETEPIVRVQKLRDFKRASPPESSLREYLERFFSLSAREEALLRQRLYSVEIELTRRCNLECPYCYSNSCKSSEMNLPRSIIKRFLLDGYNYGLRSISWLGGEPLMYPDLIKLLRDAKSIGYRESVLYTNGSLITPQIAQNLRGLVDTVAVHVDAIDSDVFKSVHFDKEPRRVRQLHRLIMRGIKSLFDAGFSGNNIRLTLTLCRPVLKGLEYLLNWAFNEMGLQTSVFIPVAPFGRGATIPVTWFPSTAEVQHAYEARAKYERRPYLHGLGIAEYCKQYQMTTCYVSADGSVTPYAGSCRSYGNVSHMDISSVLLQYYRLLAYRDKRTKEWLRFGCSNCQRSLYCFGNPVFFEAPESMTRHSLSCWNSIHEESHI
jgi:MoaA/NifB/PqqE/SkfB family radical SAM enzyme